MKDLAELKLSTSALLDVPPYSLPPAERHDALLALLKRELDYACSRSPEFHNYVRHWPVGFHSAGSIASLPYLPVGALKANPPLSLTEASEITRTLTSSATSGQQPSQVVLDAATSRRMTKGISAIIRDFIGPARRPYLVIDTSENLHRQPELGARGAAIQALVPFATKIVCCLREDSEGSIGPDLKTLQACADKWKDTEVLVYGFTHVIWTRLVLPLRQMGIGLVMPNVHVLHSGGWKRLEQQSVSKEIFVQGVSSVFGCSADRVIDYYGMVENVGVVYPDCEYGHKHVPAFADVIIRDPLTLVPVPAGQTGLIQVCSVLPTSFPGFLLLTEDMAELVGQDGCACGRRGTYFRNIQRVPKAEVRGCGNVETARHLQRQPSEIYA
jgi:hypothetical protein